MQDARQADRQAEKWIENIDVQYPGAVKSAVIFNDDLVFNTLTNATPTLLIICSNETVSLTKLVQTCDIYPTKELFPVVISEDESAYLHELHVLDLLHIKTSSRVLFGDDLLQTQEIVKELLKRETLTKIQSTLWHMRSISSLLSMSDYRTSLQEVFQRLYPSWKATLYILGSPIPTQGVQLLLSVESKCNINTFVLSRATTILESSKNSLYKKDKSLFNDLQEALEKILHTLEIS